MMRSESRRRGDRFQRLWTERSDSPFVFAHAEGANAGQAIHDLKKGFATAVENAGIEDFLIA